MREPVESTDYRSSLRAAAAALAMARRVLVITGAGVSADSGLPVYRGEGGLYDSDDTEDGVSIELALSGAMLRQRATMTGFSIYDHVHELPAFLPRMSRWLRDGAVVYVEDIHHGIEAVPDAFVGMLRGDNIGKRLVQVSDDPTAA